MEHAKRKGPWSIPIVWCATGTMCFWIPMCFIMAAANVLPTCETPKTLFGQRRHLDNFMIEYSLLVFLSGPVCQTLVALASCAGSKFCFKWSEQFHQLMGAVQLGLMIWGWVMWANTSDDLCYDPERPDQDHDINPRKLLFGMILTQTILIGLTCLVLPCVIVQMRIRAQGNA